MWIDFRTQSMFISNYSFCSDETFLVTDYCPRALLTVNSGDIVPQLPTKEMQAIGKHLIIMTLLENFEGKTIEMVRRYSETSFYLGAENIEVI